jgi:PBSX family phage portal protein
MAKNRKNQRSKQQTKPMATNKSTIDFSYDVAEPVGGQSISSLLGLFYDPFNEFYTPPLDMAGLDTLTRANGTHRRCINFKVNQMAISWKNNGLLSLRDMRRAARDLESMSNAYFEIIRNRAGGIVRLAHLPGLNMRKCKNGKFKMLMPGPGEDLDFEANEVLHAFHYDTGQTIYGVPDWIGAMQDVLLNSEATRFRRRYYLNGSHMGYILYTSDPSMDKEVEKQIREAVSSGRGVGNFKSMYINIPDGKKDAVQIIPVGDISQKDEFERVKNISADDIIVAHGVPPQLAGMKPDNVGGYGDLEKAAAWYRENEVRALVQPFLELNDYLPGNKKFIFEFN